MGLLDSLVGSVLGKALGGGQQNALVEGVMGLLSKGSGQGAGGMAGLVDMLKQKGLGNQVDSWVSTGQNQAVSGTQMQDAFGEQTIQALASKAGVSPEQASGGLAQLLPQLIDRLTPDGKMPAGGALDQGLALLKNKLLG
jgi:uncharacterized protein YidB (DUF937 family)